MAPDQWCVISQPVTGLPAWPFFISILSKSTGFWPSHLGCKKNPKVPVIFFKHLSLNFILLINDAKCLIITNRIIRPCEKSELETAFFILEISDIQWHWVSKLYVQFILIHCFNDGVNWKSATQRHREAKKIPACLCLLSHYTSLYVSSSKHSKIADEIQLVRYIFPNFSVNQLFLELIIKCYFLNQWVKTLWKQFIWMIFKQDWKFCFQIF